MHMFRRYLPLLFPRDVHFQFTRLSSERFRSKKRNLSLFLREKVTCTADDVARHHEDFVPTTAYDPSQAITDRARARRIRTNFPEDLKYVQNRNRQRDMGGHVRGVFRSILARAQAKR